MLPIKHIPNALSDLLRAMVDEFPVILDGNLVGIYLWGSLTYDAFDETCSDVDLVAITRRDIDECEFAELDQWFTSRLRHNHWASRIDMRFVIDGELLDKTSRTCGFYHYTRKMVRQGSDGNPIIWINVGQCGITLWGKDAKRIAPHVSERCLNDALVLELEYLEEDLASNAGDRSDAVFRHNAYAVLTACRILYSAHHRTLVSKEQAHQWAMETVPAARRPTVQTAKRNRLERTGSTTPELERDAMRFVRFAKDQVMRVLERAS